MAVRVSTPVGGTMSRPWAAQAMPMRMRSTMGNRTRMGEDEIEIDD